MNILVLDDNQNYMDILKANLESDGHVVCVTRKFVDARKELARGRTEVFLLDVIMPDLDGIEVAERLAQTKRNYILIGMSGGSSRVSPALGLKAMKVLGVDAILQKPFSNQTLMNKVSEVLSQ